MTIQQEISKKHEAFIKETFGGRLTIGSGNTWNDKADVITDNLQIECKATTKEAFIFTSVVLNKVTNEAYTTGRKPLLAVRVTDEFKNVEDYIVSIDNKTVIPDFRGNKNLRINLIKEADVFTFMLGGKIYKVRDLETYLEEEGLY